MFGIEYDYKDKIMKENISKHVTYREATYSNTAIRKSITNSPEPMQIDRMKIVSEKVFEPCREKFGKPIHVNSFFRSTTLNSVIGGSSTSDHCAGSAIDMDTKSQEGFSNAELFYYIKDNLEFKQLIWEYGNDNEPDWVHVSYSEGNNRGEVLRVKVIDGKTRYNHFID